MTIVQRAKEWLKEPLPDNGEPEPEEITEARAIIDGLLCEIRCLKVQVCDRGNSFQKASEKVKALRDTLKEVSGCHELHDTPKLCEGCLISISNTLAE